MNQYCLLQAPDGGSEAGCWRLLGELVVADLRSLELGPRLVCEAVARDGMRKVAAAIGEYPEPVQVNTDRLLVRPHINTEYWTVIG